MSELEIQSLFRRPRYPILCVVGDSLVAARTRQQLERRLARRELPATGNLPVIDASGEGFALHMNGMVLSPITFKKRWAKAELLDLYRRTVAREAEVPPRSDKWWLRLRIDEMVVMIAAALR